MTATASSPLLPFRRTGLLALEPSAFGEAFLVWCPPPQPFQLVAGGAAAVIDVAGPLSYDGYCTDNYSAIRARFEAALASEASTVVVRYNTPGGDVSGAFDLARMLPQLAKAAGKRYVAFTETLCASAGYALASGADRVVASDTAKLGSIGVIAVYAEQSKADTAMGLRFEIFSSGERKADGNPHQAWTADARASMQRGIDEAAEIFFDLVAARRGIKAAGLEGACFMGATAQAKGLCDAVMGWDALLLELASGVAAPTASAAKQGATQAAMSASKDSAWRKALAAAAAEGDDDAKKALAAADGPPPKDEKDEDKDKEKSKSKAEFPPKKDDDEKDDKKDDDKEKSKSKASVATPVAAADPLVAGLMAQVKAQGEQLASIAKANEDAARAEFMATRPDLTKELVAALAAKPLTEVKAIVNAIPHAGNPLAPPKLAIALPLGGAGYGLPPANAELDRLMGIAPAATKLGVRETENLQIFGVPVADGAVK